MKIPVTKKGLVLFFFLLALTISANEARAAKGAYSLAEFQGSQDSKCIPNVNSPNEVLSKNGIEPIGATEPEVQSLANGIARVQTLLKGKPIPSMWRTSYTYVTTPSDSGKYTWNQAGNTIFVRRPGNDNRGQNETRLMHELGHKIGNSGLFYNRFNAAVPEKCGLTPYCHNHERGRNEEFAEAFAGYVSRPELLKQQCPKAYDFFASQVFPGSDSLSSCGANSSSPSGKAAAATPPGFSMPAQTPRAPKVKKKDVNHGLCTSNFGCLPVKNEPAKAPTEGEDMDKKDQLFNR